MDSAKTSDLNPKKSKLASTFAKVLHIRALTGLSSVNATQKDKSQENVKQEDRTSTSNQSGSFDISEEDELHNRAELEAFLTKVFASISSVKAAYARLQYAESPFDMDGIRSADQTVVSELKILSELKRCHLKRQFDPSPETSMLLAEIQEQKSLFVMYEITGKKLESQVRLKESEAIFLKEKLEEAKKQNKSIEKRLNQSGPLSMLENLHHSGLNHSHFIRVLRQTVKSVRSFVWLVMDEMRSSGWDMDMASSVIEPDVFYWKEEHKCFAFETFFFREMFDSFHCPNFSLPNESLLERKKLTGLFFGRFMEMKSVKLKDYLGQKPRSTFAKFCRVKYLRMIHPRMESSLFGDLNQRGLINSGEVPETAFFNSFIEMARWVWLLHCLAFSFETEAKIFQVEKGSRFSDVYMESITEEVFVSPDAEPVVALGVVPGFRIGKTTIQCQAYLSQLQPQLLKLGSRKHR